MEVLGAQTMSAAPEEHYRKLTIKVSPEVHAELRQMAKERHTTVTTLLRTAVALQKFLYQHQDAYRDSRGRSNHEAGG